MDILKVSAENASEIIGKGLLDSLQVLAKDNSIENAGSAMEDLATDIANATYGMALLIAKTKEFLNLPGTSKNLGGPLSFIPIVGPLLESAAKYGATQAAKPTSNFSYSLGASATKDIERANKLLKEKNKLAADELKKLKAKSEVDKLKDKFDLERIGLTKALNETTDAETKLRLNAKIAILDNNEALAKKYNAELDGAEKAKLLADALTQAGNAALYFKDWADYRSGERGDASIVSMASSGGAVGVPMVVPSTASSFAMGGVSRGEYPVTVNVAGSILTDQNLTDTITDTILRINKMGRGTTPAGGLSGGT
jgi:hypothetical protein